eukprot:tig00000828_g4601.t1
MVGPQALGGSQERVGSALSCDHALQDASTAPRAARAAAGAGAPGWVARGESAFRALNFFTLPSRAWTDDPGKTISSLKPKRIETYALSCSRAHFVHDSGVEAVHSLRMKRTGSWSTLYQKYCEPCLETLDREPRSSGQMPSVARARSPQGAQAHRKLGARPAGLALRARFPP